ncbi:hypothetical protein PERMA_1345 [Persephonella marina EX-H1]|uniref:Uncharacterized protein n=1 Tax=Persephonella marina (strain DSM 14350 / EX-H1) TaxID=123214 RepID=C0QR18_PERMH|nr:hypothetical protein PERMA_1345 [Persephonella marina EX-H1]
MVQKKLHRKNNICRAERIYTPLGSEKTLNFSYRYFQLIKFIPHLVQKKPICLKV